MRQTGGPARSREGYHWFRGWRKPTDAQRRVLDELVAGGTYAQIAARIGISEDGVKWHVGELRDETGLADRRELAEWWQEERNRTGANVLFPLAALWRFASRNAIATVVAAGVVAVSLAVGWFAYDGLRGDDAPAASVAPVRTPERPVAVPFVPTPTPTPAPVGGLLFDVVTGEATILPGEFADRRWLDTEARTFTVLSGKPTIVDAQGDVKQISARSGVGTLPEADKHRVVVWDYQGALLEVIDTETMEVVVTGDFGWPVAQATRRWAVSAAAGKVALTDEPYDTVTIYDFDASDPIPVFTAGPDESVWNVDWSRDGEWLLIGAVTEENGDIVKERSLVFRPDGTLLMEYAARANWVGARTLRLYKRESDTRVVLDSIVDLAHQGKVPIPEGELLCVSPDGRYAVTAEPESSAFNAPTEHRLVDLVTGDVVSSVVMNRFLVNCDWTPDGSKAILSSGGK